MKLRNLINLAAGLILAFVAGPGAAAIAWNTDGTITLFEDDDVDFHIDNDGDNLISVGDYLIAALELNASAGVDIGPEELTGISIIEVDSFIDADMGGVANDIVFAPAAIGFDAVMESIIPGFTDLLAGGGAGEGAMAAFWVDTSPDLDISADTINTAAGPTCTTLALCLAQAGDGTLWQVDGFDVNDPDLDDGWLALNAQTNPAIPSLANAGSGSFAGINVGLSILYNGTGQNLAENSISCFPFCAPGGDGAVDMFAQGDIQGGGNNDGGIPPQPQDNYEWFATSDFNLGKRAEVPLPGTLALLGIGLLMIGSRRRSRG